jgi:hypothetical protein
MSFKKPFKAVPLKRRAKRSSISNMAFRRQSKSNWRGMLLPFGVAVAAGVALGSTWSEKGDIQPEQAQSFVAQRTDDRIAALRRMEADEPPETLSAITGRSDRANERPALVGEAKVGFAFYRVCEDARRAGVAPLFRGQPGYRDALDRDGDGVACEPYLGR